jgi:ankyrin repeat protein
VLQHCFPQSIRRTLNELPNSLDETYERVLKEIGMANRNHAHRLLQCLTVAIRPLRVEELAEILALDIDEAQGTTPTLNKDWRWEDRQRAVLSACSSLVTLVDDGDSRVIQFSHFSVKEFLTSDRISTSKHDTCHFHIMAEPAHTTLAQACLGTLFQLDGNSDNSQVEASFPLAIYASQHWVEHAQFGMVSSRIEDSMRHLFDSTKPYFTAWLQLHDMDSRWTNFGISMATDRGSPLYYASLCGFRDLASHIIAEHPEQVNARVGRNYSPLVVALRNRQFSIAELLYQHGAAVDVPGCYNVTPLYTASMGGLIDVARWLLDHGADAHLQHDDLSTPISLASEFGYPEIVRMLLRYKVRLDIANSGGYTPLHLASALDHVEIVRLLLQHGADVSTKDRVHHRTPLHLAYSLEVVNLLLDHGADIDAESKYGKTPLHSASYRKNREPEIVRLLLERGANANAKSRDGWTPLHGASSCREPAKVRLLLDHGADANATDKDGRTPLHQASSEGEELNVRLLLERGASANAKDEEGRTPVQLASRHEIMQIFREHGARVDGG